MSGTSNATFVGVDGCKAGWFSVSYDADQQCDTGVFRSFWDLLDHHANARLVLVDIPIGLRDRGSAERCCDSEARVRLGKRRTSVFFVPPRLAAHQRAYEDAAAITKTLTGRGLSLQSWNISPKIAQVDSVMVARSADATPAIREVHPELCFWALGGREPMKFSKKKAPGRDERIRVLHRTEPNTDKILSEALRLHSHHAEPDDILDALAAAVTARLGYPDGFQTVPANPPKDAYGLPMEMVFVELGTP